MATEHCEFCKVPVHGLSDWKGKLLCGKCMDEVEKDVDDAGRKVHRFNPDPSVENKGQCLRCKQMTATRDIHNRYICLVCGMRKYSKEWGDEKAIGEGPGL